MMLVLQHDQNTFSFEFSRIGFQHALANGYEYKLENYDENWIESGSSRYTRYSKIPPGKYTFQLRTRDVKGDISPYIEITVYRNQKSILANDCF